MTELAPQADPAEAGLDKERLARVNRHFARYVDDGRLPGWLLTVSRYGRLVHVSRYGSADMEAGLPVETGTLWRILLHDQAGHVGRGDDAVRGGRLRADRPGQRVHPVIRRRARVRGSDRISSR